MSPSPIHSTPRPPKQKRPSVATYSSPYETLKRETFGTNPNPSPSDSTLPSTPRTNLPSPGQDADSSPFAPPSTSHRIARTPANDILLHRVLDKNWRLQATPHSTARNLPYRNNKPSAMDQTPKPSTAKKAKAKAKDDYDLDSSPAVPAPELHAEIFDTPARKTRVPGVSILTPARGRRKSNVKSATRGRSQEATAGIWDSDSDEDEAEGMGGGMSPPKTMQFHIPQARLLRTPGELSLIPSPTVKLEHLVWVWCLTKNIACEASKRIVEDLLLTAGGSVTDDLEEDSPSVVRRAGIADEDTF